MASKILAYGLGSEPNNLANRLTDEQPYEQPSLDLAAAQLAAFQLAPDALALLLRACGQAQGRLLGMLGAVGGDTELQ